MRMTLRVGAAVALTAATLTLPATASALPGGEENEDGYGVEADVRLTGDAAPDGGGEWTVYVPPVCWWEQLPGGWADATDPEAVYEYFLSEIQGNVEPRERLSWPDEEVFLDAIEQEENGVDMTWYRVRSGSGMQRQCTDDRNYGDVWNITPIYYAPFVHNDPPAPVIDPEDLAEEARDLMVIDEPEIDHNPKGTGALAGGTLVDFPTWFWVTNPDESVGGPNGERHIRAEVVGSNVWAEVTALTDGLSVGSPAGGEDCEPEIAITEWTPGAADDSGCVVIFNRASVQYPNGYPVTASTDWSATWEGQTQGGEAVGGDLDPLSLTAPPVNVPVAEVQTTVQGPN